MTTPDFRQLENRITWLFVLSEQGVSSRYGKLGRLFYKQFIGGGKSTGGTSPPRSISAQVFSFAQRTYYQQSNSK